MRLCCAGAAFFWGWRFQMFSRGPKRALYGWSLPVAKACGNAMKIVIWPVLILPLSYVFTTPLRCSLNDLQHFLQCTVPHIAYGWKAGMHTCLACVCIAPLGVDTAVCCRATALAGY